MGNAATESTRFGVELRAEVTGNKLCGYGAIFDQYAELPGHLETLSRSAFDAVLADKSTDVRCLYNHDTSKVLGRQSAGNLRIGVDSRGLSFEADLPDTSYARDVRAMVEAGLITGASFGFVAGQDAWSQIDGKQIRTHTSVSRLVEISAVAFPAYQGATVMLRSLDEACAPLVETQRSQLIRARHRVRLRNLGRT